MSLSFDELRSANVARCESSYHPVLEWSPTEWLMCVTGELGELAGEMKQMRRGNEVPHEKLRHELADIVIYLDLLATALNVDLGEAVAEKFNIVSDRVGARVRLVKNAMGEWNTQAPMDLL